MSAAAELRKAAETLRERAKAATPGRWEAWSGSSAGGGEYITSAPRGETFGITPHLSGEAGQKVANSDAAYIATVHPGVGLALADAFEMTAIAMDSMGAHLPNGEAGGLWTDTGAPMYEWDATLRVARIINGGV